uniref:Uncharacterized protein n=1 Tax=Timema douglasi TaxID=61478 RepID=A0A7R8VNK3_TIMDO|nr:unnamed protein product [Timema douglasi]
MSDLNIIQKFKGTSDICKAVHLVECPCLFGLPHAHKFQKFREIMHRCQEVENEVAHKSRFLCNVCRAGSTCGKPTLLLEQWDLQLLRHPHFTSSRQESDTAMQELGFGLTASMVRYNLTLKTPKKLAAYKAPMANHETMRDFFEKLGTLMDALGIKNMPGRLWNCDEIGLSYVVKPGRVITAVGKEALQPSQLTKKPLPEALQQINQPLGVENIGLLALPSVSIKHSTKRAKRKRDSNAKCITPFDEHSKSPVPSTVMSKMSSPTLEPSTSADKRRPKRPAGRPKTKKPGTSGEDWECGVYGINSGRYDMKEDFSVVIQPLTEEVIFPEKLPAIRRYTHQHPPFSPKKKRQGSRYYQSQLYTRQAEYIRIPTFNGSLRVMSPGDTNSELHGDNEDSTSGVPDCGTPTTDISGQPAAGELPAKKKAKKVVDQSSKIPMKKIKKPNSAVIHSAQTTRRHFLAVNNQCTSTPWIWNDFHPYLFSGANYLFPVSFNYKKSIVKSNVLNCPNRIAANISYTANALWNNLLEPVSNKSKNWSDPFSIFLCPTEERPYFFTKKNNPI